MSKRKKGAVRNDGYFNAFLNRGFKQYAINNSFFEDANPDYWLLQKLWSNRLAQRISSLPAEAALKQGYKIIGDEQENKILQYLDERCVNEKLVEAMTWARHFGRGCIFMLLDDGGTEEDPVNLNRLQSLRGMEVFDKQCIVEDFSGYLNNDDPMDPNFGKTEWYQVTPPYGGRTMYIHHSRLLLFDGGLLPVYDKIARGGGGMSCLEGLVTAIRRCDTAQGTALNVMERMSTSLTKFNRLAELLSTEQGEENVRRRLDIIDMARNILNTIAISTDDDYQVFNVPVSGIDNLLDSFGQYICALTGIPFTILFGRSPGGLNTTGKGDLEAYYSDVAGKIQNTMLKPQLEKLIRTVQYAADGPTGGKELADWTIQFNPLWAPTDKEVAETEKLKADKEQIYVNMTATLLDRQMIGPVAAKELLAAKAGIQIDMQGLDLGDIDGQGTE